MLPPHHSRALHNEKNPALKSLQDDNYIFRTAKLETKNVICSGWIFSMAKFAMANESSKRFKLDKFGGSGWI